MSTANLDRWLSEMTPTNGAQEVARAYLSLHRAEATESRLRQLMLAESDLSGELHSAIRQDFARDATVAVHGWVLSRTEARLAALYQLLHP